MVFTAPPNAGGIGGRGRIATQEELDCWDRFNYNYQRNASTITPTHRQTTRPNRQNLNYVRDGTIVKAAVVYMNKTTPTMTVRVIKIVVLSLMLTPPSTPPEACNNAQALGPAAGRNMRPRNASDPICANLTGEHPSSWSNTVQLPTS
jgi:hypothetical protein